MLIDGMRAPGKGGSKYRRANLKRLKVRNEDDERVPTGKVGHGKDLRSRGLNWWDKSESRINVAPLRRMLRAHLGNRWSSVRSALLEGTRPLDRHMLELELDWHVAKGSDVVLRDRRAYKATTASPLFERFYEHPVTGLLCENPKDRGRWKAPVDPNAPFEIDGNSYVVKDGLWYRRIVSIRVDTVIVRCQRTWLPTGEIRKIEVEEVTLRQISGKERDRLIAKAA